MNSSMIFYALVGIPPLGVTYLWLRNRSAAAYVE